MANPFQSALKDSEREIFDYGVHVQIDQEEFDAITDAEQNDELIAENSQVEGFDGEHVSDAEGMARAIQGDDATPGYIGDRPLQYQHELAVDAENQRLRQELDAARNQTGQMRAQYDPQFRAQQELNRAQFLDQHGLVAVDENRANAFLQQAAGLEQQQMQQHKQRIESSEARAIEEYGQRAYDEAISAFRDIEHTPVAQNIKQLVFNSPHPMAKTLMAMMQDEGINSLLLDKRLAAAVLPNPQPTAELPAGARQYATRPGPLAKLTSTSRPTPIMSSRKSSVPHGSNGPVPNSNIARFTDDPTPARSCLMICQGRSTTCADCTPGWDDTRATSTARKRAPRSQTWNNR